MTHPITRFAIFGDRWFGFSTQAHSTWESQCAFLSNRADEVRSAQPHNVQYTNVTLMK